jgi:hypothetical protein
MRPSVFLLLSVVGAAEFIFPDWSLTGDDLWAYNPDEYNPDIFSQEEYYSDGDIQTQSDLYEEPFLVVNDNLPLDLDIHITDETGWVDYPTSDLFADSSDDCYGSSDEEFLLFGKNRLRPRQGQTCSARRNKKKKTTTNENDENLGFPGLDEISAKVTVNEFSEQQCPSASYPNAGVPVCSSGNRDDEGQSLIFENALILTNCKRSMFCVSFFPIFSPFPFFPL